MTIEKLNKMRACLCLLPPPGDQVANELLEEIDRLRHALDRIANPVKNLHQEAANEGCELNGQVAMKLAADARYLRDIAVDALKDRR